MPLIWNLAYCEGFEAMSAIAVSVFFEEWTPGHIADAVAFLCSPQAPFITGAILPVDGGYSAG